MNKNNNGCTWELTAILVFISILPLVWNVDGHTAGMIKLTGLGRVNVEKDTLFLGDIVDIQSDGGERDADIAQIKVGQVPPLGNYLEIKEQDICQILTQASVGLEQIDISLSQPIIVSRSYTDVSKEYIEKAVINFIQRETPHKNSEISVRNVRWAGNIRLPSGEITHKIQKKYQLDLVGSVPLSLMFFVNGKLEKRIVVVAQVEVLSDVAFSDKPLARGQIIQPSDLKLIKYELSQIKGTPIKSLEQAAGKRTIHAIFPHQILLEEDVEVPPILKRGDLVKIVVSSDYLLATARGEVRENGKIGDKVKVVNIDSKKWLEAIVVDSQTVRIEF